MTAQTLFSICNSLALGGWLLLVVRPGWKWTRRVVGSGLVSLLLAGVYLVLIATTFGRAEGGFGSLAEVSLLFRNEWVLLAGWVHYLAFDLFIGSWEVSDARRLKVSHLLVIPCLILTFMLGPIGLLAYHLVSLKARLQAGRQEEQ